MKVNEKEIASSKLKGQEVGGWADWLLEGVQPLALEMAKALGSHPTVSWRGTSPSLRSRLSLSPFSALQAPLKAANT